MFAGSIWQWKVQVRWHWASPGHCWGGFPILQSTWLMIGWSRSDLLRGTHSMLMDVKLAKSDIPLLPDTSGRRDPWTAVPGGFQDCYWLLWNNIFINQEGVHLHASPPLTCWLYPHPWNECFDWVCELLVFETYGLLNVLHVNALRAVVFFEIPTIVNPLGLKYWIWLVWGW